MEFVEFHAEATGLTTSSTITLPFDRSITSASDVKGVVLMAQGRVTDFGWTMISHGWSVGVYDGTNEMCKWAGASRGSSDESEYREHWYDNSILVNWDEATNSTYAVCSISSISTTGITLAVDDVAGTNVALKLRGYAIVGSDVSCEAKSVIQSTLTSGATTDLDYSTLTSADVVMGWAFSNDNITNTLLPDEAGGTITDYRGHYSPGQWFATTSGTRSMWGHAQDGGTLVDTAIYQKSDGKVYCTVTDVSGTLNEDYVSASLQHGGTANRLRLTNDAAQARGWGMVTLAIETSNQTAIGTMKRDVSDTGTETIAPGFTGVGLVQTMSMAGFANDEDVPDENQPSGNQFSINFGMGGNVRTSGAGVGCFGMGLSMRDANGAVRYRNVHWTASANTTMAASEADSDWLNEVASTQFAPGSTTGTTNNDVVYQYISAVNSTTGDMTVTYQDPLATGSQNKGMRTYWLAIEEGGGDTGQTVTLTTSIGSEEAFDTQALVLDPYFIGVSSPGIATAEAFGDPVTLALTGGDVSDVGDIDDTTVFGLTELVANINITPTEDIDESGVGSPELIYPQPIIIPNDAAIDSAEDFGTTTIQPPEFLIEVSGAGIAPPAGQVDDPILTTIRDVIVETSITTPHGQGGLPPQVPEPTLASQFQFLVIEDAGIETAEAFEDDAFVVEPNPVLTVVDGIESGEGFEDDANLHKVMGTVPESIESGEAFGTPFLEFDQFIDAEAVASGESVGKPFLRYPYLPMYPETVQPRENFGIPTVVGGEYRPYSTPTTALNASYDRAWEGNASLDVSWSGSAQSETQQDLSASSD